MQRSTWLAILLLMTAALMLYTTRSQPVPSERPEVLFRRAEDLAAKAGSDKKELKRVEGLYRQIAKLYPKTEYAARARLLEAKLVEEKFKDPYRAVQAYKSIIHDFAKTSEAAVQAEARIPKLEEQMDRKNSTKLLYKIMDFSVARTGRNPKYSYFLALLLTTLVVKVLIWPLTHAQFKSMREMQKVTPLVKQLQEKYKGKQKEMSEKMWALYKEHGINPLSGCLPALAQFPVLILLYQMVRLYSVQFTKGEFLWIGSGLSAKYPSLIGTSLAAPDIPLIFLYVVSSFIAQRLTIVDPSQAEQQKIMGYGLPIIFAVMFRTLPSAFILYWLVLNIMSTIQQYYVLKQTPGGPSEAGGETGGTLVEPPKISPVKPGTKSKKSKKKGGKSRKHFERSSFPSPALREVVVPAG